MKQKCPNIAEDNEAKITQHVGKLYTRKIWYWEWNKMGVNGLWEKALGSDDCGKPTILELRKFAGTDELND